MNIYDVNPYIRRTLRHSVISINGTISPRVILDFELIYIERGTLLFSYNDEERICPRGTVIFIHPGVRHSFVKVIEEIDQPHIHFDLSYDAQSQFVPISFKPNEELTNEERGMLRENPFKQFELNPYIKVSDQKRFNELFFQAIEAHDGDPLVAKARLTELLALIIEDNFKSTLTALPETKIEQYVKDFIDAGQGVAFELDDFAKKFSYDKYYLEKRFNKSYGTGIIAYRNAKRMEIAKGLLQSHSVSYVSERLGFSSIYSFSRAYKLFYGHSPSVVKKHT